MVRCLVRLGSVCSGKFWFPQYSISVNICSALALHLKVVSSQLPDKVVRDRGRRCGWKVDSTVKDAFNDIIKRSHSFTAAEAQKAMKHFSDFTKTEKVPDYMAVKMASVITTHLGWEEGRKVLEVHYMSHGAELRFAGEASVMDEQVEGAVRRIFDNVREDAYKIARQFYCRLIDLKFCKVKNRVSKVFIEELLKKNKIKQAIEEFDYFSHYGKHGSLSGVAFLVLRAAFKEDDELFQRAVEVFKGSIKSHLQRTCILISVFLAEGFHIKCVDFLREQNYKISIEDVGFICNLARKCKEPAILESLLIAHELFSLNDKLRAQLYESLIEIHGKANNLGNLLKIWERIVVEKKLNNFRVAILKLGHFYKCSNFTIPNDMQYYLRQYRE